MAVEQTDVLVIGGGMAGLMAAGTLRGRGLRITLVEKGVRVGGRLATRRIGPGRGDHGAQFFTARSAEFQTLVAGWLAEGIALPWANGFGDGSSDPIPANGHPRYIIQGGMNALAQHLARRLLPEVTIETSLHLAALTPAGDGWQARADDGRLYACRTVVLTAPVPRSLELLDLDIFTESDRAALQRIEYAPCLAGLFWVDGDVNLPEPGAVQRPNEWISWIADNRRKGISPEATVITVHTGPQSSRELWETTERDALATLQAALEPFLAPGAGVREAQLKAWRYALPTVLHPERYLRAAGLPPLVFAGDAFGGPRVEGAALSGLEAGRALAALLETI
ncbi:MAG: FAD-dependent oxidoreductase [Chloroflexi bacterium]|nr:FAD-dependent oxidoreductase [Chloroflexota bacterium]